MGDGSTRNCYAATVWHPVAGKVNWLGIGPHKVAVAGKRGPEVTFDHFLYYGTCGPDFRELAPVLAEHIYANNVRSILQGLTPEEHAEAIRILDAAADASPSPGRDTATKGGQGDRHGETKCQPKRCD